MKGVRAVTDELIVKYGRRLYGLCIALCRDRDMADDLYQETWLKVLKGLRTYDRERDFEPWLTKICVNTYKSLRRKRRLSPVYDGFSTSEEKERALASVPMREDGEDRELRDAVSRLPEKLRVAVILCYFYDMDIRTAAAALKIPEGTVKSRLNRARSILREVLE